MNIEARNRVAEARIVARKKLPYLTHQVLSMTPIERPGLGTLCVDKYLRVYYDPAFVLRTDLTLDDLSFIVLHECLHPLYLHHVRRKGLTGDAPPPDRLKFYRIAADCAVNDTLVKSGLKCPEEGQLPSKYGFPSGLALEQYFDLLLEKAEEERKRRQEEEEKARQEEQKDQGDDSNDQQDQDEGEGDEEDEEDDDEQADEVCPGMEDGDQDHSPGSDEGSEAEDEESGEGQGQDEGSEGEGEDQQEHGGGEGHEVGVGESPSSSENGDGGDGGEAPAEGPGNQPTEGGDSGTDVGADSAGGGRGGRTQQGDDGCGDVPGNDRRPGPGDAYDGPLPDRSEGDGGSGCDGIDRPWECGEPTKQAPGLREHEQDLIRDVVAKDIEEHQRTKGNVPGNLLRVAKRILKPRVDPLLVLEKMLRHCVTTAPGFGRWTYRKASRRNPPDGTLLPANVKPVPRLAIIADTSGSMQEKDLALTMGVADRVLKGLVNRSEITVYAGDTQIAAVSKIVLPEQIKFAGGGGTAMDVLLEEVAKTKPMPQVVLVCTDGETGWPDHPMPFHVLVCLTRQSKWCEPPPSWMFKVVLHPEE